MIHFNVNSFLRINWKFSRIKIALFWLIKSQDQKPVIFAVASGRLGLCGHPLLSGFYRRINFNEKFLFCAGSFLVVELETCGSRRRMMDNASMRMSVRFSDEEPVPSVTQPHCTSQKSDSSQSSSCSARSCHQPVPIKSALKNSASGTGSTDSGFAGSVYADNDGTLLQHKFIFKIIFWIFSSLNKNIK